MAFRAKNLIKIPALTHSIQLFFTTRAIFLLPELSNIALYSVQCEISAITFQKTLQGEMNIFKILNFEIFKILKTPAGLQKVPSYAVELSKRPLNLMRLSL
jgi:hypothetical protein